MLIPITSSIPAMPPGRANTVSSLATSRKHGGPQLRAATVTIGQKKALQGHTDTRMQQINTPMIMI